MEELSDDDQEEMKAHFNDLCGEDADDIGDKFFGDQADFEARWAGLEQEHKDKFTAELLVQSILDPSAFQDD